MERQKGNYGIQEDELEGRCTGCALSLAVFSMLGWMQTLHARNGHRNSFIVHALEGLRFVFIHCHTTDAPTPIPACFLLTFL